METYKTVLRNTDDPNWKFSFSFNRIERIAHFAGRFVGLRVYLRDIAPQRVNEEIDLSFQKYFYGEIKQCSWVDLAKDSEHDLAELLAKENLHLGIIQMVEETIEECKHFIAVHEGRQRTVHLIRCRAQRKYFLE